MPSMYPHLFFNQLNKAYIIKNLHSREGEELPSPRVEVARSRSPVRVFKSASVPSSPPSSLGDSSALLVGRGLETKRELTGGISL